VWAIVKDDTVVNNCRHIVMYFNYVVCQKMHPNRYLRISTCSLPKTQNRFVFVEDMASYRWRIFETQCRTVDPISGCHEP